MAVCERFSRFSELNFEDSKTPKDSAKTLEGGSLSEIDRSLIYRVFPLTTVTISRSDEE